MKYAIAYRVLRIIGQCSSRQVYGTIVERIVVQMPDYPVRRTLGRQEGIGYQDGHPMSSSLAVKIQAHFQITASADS
jgi:hypothetical protein